MTDERSHIHGRPRFGDCRDVVIEGRIAEVVGFAQQAHWVGQIAFQPDRRGANAAIADDDGRYTLRDLGKHFGSFDDAGVVVRVDVDKAGCERHALRVPCFIGMATERGAEFADSAIPNRDVDGLGLGSGAINRLSISNVQIAVDHPLHVRI